MIDRESPRVRPPYRLEFLEADELSISGWNKDVVSITSWSALPFFDRDSGKSRFAVVVSEDVRLISNFTSLVTFNGPVSEQEVREAIQNNSSRRPSASIVYADSGEKGVVCLEDSCIFNFEQGCVNPQVLIDDSPGDSWCLTYQPKEEK